MKTTESDVVEMQDSEGQLENALIEEFLRRRGFDATALHRLPKPEAARILADASAYAAAKLAEVESRAHYVREIHGQD